MGSISCLTNPVSNSLAGFPEWMNKSERAASLSSSKTCNRVLWLCRLRGFPFLRDIPTVQNFLLSQTRMKKINFLKFLRNVKMTISKHVFPVRLTYFVSILYYIRIRSKCNTLTYWNNSIKFHQKWWQKSICSCEMFSFSWITIFWWKNFLSENFQPALLMSLGRFGF